MAAQHNTPTMEGIIYVRYSTVMQEDGYTEKIQIDECRKILKEKGCLDPLIYCDKAKTGTTMKGRPGLEKAFDRLREGMVLVSYSLCRLTRSTQDAYEILERINHCGAHLMTVREKIDTSAPTGHYLFSTFAAMAAVETQNIKGRVKLAMEYKKSLGHRLGRVSYGNSLAPDGFRLQPNQAEMDLIHDIVRYRNMKGKTGNNPLSYKTISEILNNDKSYPPARNKTKKWHASTVLLLYKSHENLYVKRDEESYELRKRSENNYKKLQNQWAKEDAAKGKDNAPTIISYDEAYEHKEVPTHENPSKNDEHEKSSPNPDNHDDSNESDEDISDDSSDDESDFKEYMKYRKYKKQMKQMKLMKKQNKKSESSITVNKEDSNKIIKKKDKK